MTQTSHSPLRAGLRAGLTTGLVVGLLSSLITVVARPGAKRSLAAM